MRIPIKHFIGKISEVFGYQITRTSKPPEAFAVQKDLIGNTEPVIFDIGAHIGDVARLYGNIFPHARIYCFEPSTRAFDQLCRATSGDSRILCYQQAICETTGKVVLNENVSDATNSLLPTDDRAFLSWGGAFRRHHNAKCYATR